MAEDGSYKNNIENTGNKSSEMPASAESAKDSALKKVKINYGNKAYAYSQEARTVSGGGYLFYTTENKTLVRRSSAGNVKRYDKVKVRGGLNYYRDKLFFISDKDGLVYFIKGDNSPVRDKNVVQEILSLIICEKGYIYTDRDNHLRFLSNKGTESVICHEHALWASGWGQWIVYTRLSDRNVKGIYSYNLINGDKKRLLDYGMCPVIFGNLLYYQTKDGGTGSFNLSTGKKADVTDVWGQNFSRIGSFLYFSSIEKIFKMNLKTKRIKIVYNAHRDWKNATIEKVWIQDGRLVFTEKLKKERILWKVLDSRGEAFEYEKKF